MFLKQSTAGQTELIGPFLDDTDFITEETGLTIANTDIRLSKSGGNTVAKNSGGATHDELGMYQITLDATDTDTVGSLRVYVSVAGALPVWRDFYVLEEAIYDALFGASASAFDASANAKLADGHLTAAKFASNAITADKIATDAITAAKIAANAITSSELADNAITAAKIATDAIGSDELAATAVAEIVDGVWDEAKSGHTTQGTYGESFSTIVSTAVNDASATTTSFITDLTEATDDHYIGRVIIFTTGALQYQATDITDYDGTTKTLTVTALTEAPANNDQFIII